MQIVCLNWEIQKDVNLLNVGQEESYQDLLQIEFLFLHYWVMVALYFQVVRPTVCPSLCPSVQDSC